MFNNDINFNRFQKDAGKDAYSKPETRHPFSLPHIPYEMPKIEPLPLPSKDKPLDVYPKTQKVTNDITAREMNFGEYGANIRPETSILVNELNGYNDINSPNYRKKSLENPNRNEAREFYIKANYTLFLECFNLVRESNAKKTNKNRQQRFIDAYKDALHSIGLCAICSHPLKQKFDKTIPVKNVPVVELNEHRSMFFRRTSKKVISAKISLLRDKDLERFETKHNDDCPRDNTCNCRKGLRYNEFIKHTKDCNEKHSKVCKVKKCDCARGCKCSRKGELSFTLKAPHFSQITKQNCMSINNESKPITTGEFSDIPSHFEIDFDANGKMIYRFVGIIENGKLLNNIFLKRIPRTISMRNDAGELVPKTYYNDILVRRENGKDARILHVPKTYRITESKCQCK